MGKSHSKNSKKAKAKSQSVFTNVAPYTVTSVTISPQSTVTRSGTSIPLSIVTSASSSSKSSTGTGYTTSSPPPAITIDKAFSPESTGNSFATSSNPSTVNHVVTTSTPPAVTSVVTSSTQSTITSVDTSIPPSTSTSLVTSSPLTFTNDNISIPRVANSCASPPIYIVGNSRPLSTGTSVANCSLPSTGTYDGTSIRRPAPTVTGVATNSHTPAVTTFAACSPAHAVTSVATSIPAPAVTSIASNSLQSTVTSVAARSLTYAVTNIATSSATPAVTSVAISSPETEVTSYATSSPPSAVQSIVMDSPLTCASIAINRPLFSGTYVVTKSSLPVFTDEAISSTPLVVAGIDTICPSYTGTTVVTSSSRCEVTSVVANSRLPSVISVATRSPSLSLGNIVTTKSPLSEVNSVPISSPFTGVNIVTTSNYLSTVTGRATWSPLSAFTSVVTSSTSPKVVQRVTAISHLSAVSSVTTSSPKSAITCEVTSSSSPIDYCIGTFSSGTSSPIPPEETNFLRFYLLCQKLAVDSVRSFFDRSVPPVDLHYHLRIHESNLRGKWKCYQEQLKVLFPAIPLLPLSINFDFSLLYKLIRNTLSVPAPAQGWGKEPLTNDVSETDDVERVRKFRNFLAHSEQCLLTESDFQMKWTELSQAIHRLSNGALTSDVNDLKLKPLNQDIRNQMVDDILLFRKEVNELQQDTEDMRKLQAVQNMKLDEQNTRIENLEARPVPDHIPKHIRENHHDQLLKWAADEEVFYCDTEAVKKALFEIKSNNIVTIIGGPGSGKTSLARHVALQYKKSGYEIVPVCSPGKIEDFGDKNINQLFILDDVLGVFSVDMSLFNILISHKESILNVLGINSKLICTSRKSVFNEAKKWRCFILDTVIDIEDGENHLNENNKKHILQNHCKKAKISPGVYEGIVFKNSHPMFPLLCRMFSLSKKYQEKGQKFFDYPIDCVTGELDKMEKYHYAVLVVGMLCSKKIPVLDKPLSIINEELIKEVFDACSECPLPSNRLILDALQNLDGTYLTKSDKEYTFMHDSIFEIVAYHFGKANVELMIKRMPSSFVCNKIILSKSKSDDDLKIEIKDVMYSKLAERLYKDIQDGHLYDVFSNSALSQTHFVDVFMDTLKKQMSYQQFKKLFFEVIEGDTDHITNQTEQMAVNKKDGTINNEVKNHQELLLGFLYRDFNNQGYSIRIISFIVYYGHSRLLQCIIDYVLCNDDQISSVFGSDRAEQVRMLTLGAYSNNSDVIKVLLKYTEKQLINLTSLSDGMDNFSNWHRLQTPFSAACSVGNLSIVKMFYEMNAVINPVNKPYYTPLTAAAEGGHCKVVEFLVNHEGDVNPCTVSKKSPLYVASWRGHYDVVVFLVNHGGEVNLCGEDNKSPLFAASQEGHLNVVEFLIKHGGDVNLLNERNESPLYVASQGSHFDVVQLLVYHGGEVNLCTRKNESPLFVASRKGHYKVVEFLVLHGAEVNICNEREESSLNVALRNRNSDVYQFLLNHGGKLSPKDTATKKFH